LTQQLSVFLDLLCAFVELGAVSLSLRYVLRQKISRLHDAKVLLVAPHAFILMIFLLEFLREFFYTSGVYMQFFAVGTVSLILWIGICLTALSYIIYFRPPEPALSTRIVALLTKRFFPMGLGMLLFIAYLAALDLFLLSSNPFKIVSLSSWTGAVESVPKFDNTFLVFALIALATFLLFPSLQCVLAIRRVPDRSTRRAVAVFIAGWDLIALDGVFIIGFLPVLGVNVLQPGQLVAGLLLAMTGLATRRSTVLEELMKPLETEGLAIQTPGPNTAKPPQASNFRGTMLLEADPSANYEKAALDFAQEMISCGRVVLAFTSRRSPVHLLLKDVPGIRFFILSETAYPKPTENPLEVLVPRNDLAVLLSVIEEAIATAPERPKAMIFDNVSSLIMDAGFQESYKFLRQANEMSSSGDLVSIFLILSKAHEDQVMNMVKNLYSGYLTYDSDGLHVVKRY
jgi:hypothetical protein